MNYRKLIAPVAVVILMIVAAAAIEGHWSDRWGSESRQLDQFNARLKQVPQHFGPWVSRTVEIDARQIEVARLTGVISRVYQHRETGEQVSMMLVCGPSRHITLHTPDQCYPDAGFESRGDPEPFVVNLPDGQSVEFSTTEFAKEDASSRQQLRIFWTFSKDGTWQGPRWPRVTYAGNSALYKIYLMTAVNGPDDLSPENSPAIDLAKAMLPQVQRVLFPQLP